jgi:hypothetical protein
MANRHTVEKGHDLTMHGHMDNIGPRKALADRHQKERADVCLHEKTPIGGSLIQIAAQTCSIFSDWETGPLTIARPTVPRLGSN